MLPARTSTASPCGRCLIFRKLLECTAQINPSKYKNALASGSPVAGIDVELLACEGIRLLFQAAYHRRSCECALLCFVSHGYPVPCERECVGVLAVWAPLLQRRRPRVRRLPGSTNQSCQQQPAFDCIQPILSKCHTKFSTAARTKQACGSSAELDPVQLCKSIARFEYTLVQPSICPPEMQWMLRLHGSFGVSGTLICTCQNGA